MEWSGRGHGGGHRKPTRGRAWVVEACARAVMRRVRAPGVRLFRIGVHDAEGRPENRTAAEVPAGSGGAHAPALTTPYAPGSR